MMAGLTANDGFNKVDDNRSDVVGDNLGSLDSNGDGNEE